MSQAAAAITQTEDEEGVLTTKTVVTDGLAQILVSIRGIKNASITTEDLNADRTHLVRALTEIERNMMTISYLVDHLVDDVDARFHELRGQGVLSATVQLDDPDLSNVRVLAEVRNRTEPVEAQGVSASSALSTLARAISK